MAYRLTIERSAVKAIEALDSETYRRVRSVIDQLVSDPRPAGCRKLVGADDLWRIRVGDWRIVYAVRDDELLVLVVRVAHRRDVYR